MVKSIGNFAKDFQYNENFLSEKIDFIAEKQGEKIYVQVAYLIADDKVKEREFGNLLKIKDNYRRIVLSVDEFSLENYKGIGHKSLIEFISDIS